MASKRHLRRKRCENKQPYPSLQSAAMAIKALHQQNPDAKISRYTCGKHYHVGHTPRRNHG